jgi:hypothetical protein
MFHIVRPHDRQPPPAIAPSQALRCPICGGRLAQDLWWRSLHWLCPQGHSYSNVRALIAELRERGWLPESYSLGE